MALSVFLDALPFNEVTAHYGDYFSNSQVSELLPNIAYSSSLHWQLYCDKYPDDRGTLVDWVKQPETDKTVKTVAKLCACLDRMGSLGFLSRKVLNRFVFRRNAFANIPYRFRSDFTERGKYLFCAEKTYRAESIFEGFTVVSQDEGHKKLDVTLEELQQAVDRGDKNIFAVFGFADAIGHLCRRGELYSQRLRTSMEALLEVVRAYAEKNPEEEILIVSDHGMSSVVNHVDLDLEAHFGKPSKNSYIAYLDSAVMCIWCPDETLRGKISAYLQTRAEGHLLTEEERQHYRATDPKFGDLIYILREGNVFSNNWFGKSIKKPRPEGSGMHGFWPERSAKDQMACIWLINGKRELQPESDYPYANQIITQVMKGM